MKKRELKKPKLWVHLVVIAVTLIITILSIINTCKIVENYQRRMNLKTNYVLEYATVVKYKTFLSDNGYDFYYTYYEFIAADGTKYEGIWEANIYDEEEAKAQIGQKVPIYIDHELHLQTDDPNYRPSLGGAWFCGVVALVSLGVMLYSIIRLLHWYIASTKQNV